MPAALAIGRVDRLARSPRYEAQSGTTWHVPPSGVSASRGGGRADAGIRGAGPSCGSRREPYALDGIADRRRVMSQAASGTRGPGESRGLAAPRALEAEREDVVAGRDVDRGESEAALAMPPGRRRCQVAAAAEQLHASAVLRSPRRPARDPRSRDPPRCALARPSGQRVGRRLRRRPAPGPVRAGPGRSRSGIPLLPPWAVAVRLPYAGAMESTISPERTSRPVKAPQVLTSGRLFQLFPGLPAGPT